MKYVLLSFLSLALLAACSSFSIKRDFIEGYDFKKLKTYKIVALNKRNLTKDSINGKRAIVALEQILNQKGYSNLSTGGADFLAVLDYDDIKYVKLRSSSIEMGLYSASRGAMGDFGVGYGFGQRDDRATLRIKLLDGVTSKEIWIGSATGYFEKEKPRDTTKKFKEALEEILKTFPAYSPRLSNSLDK